MHSLESVKPFFTCIAIDPCASRSASDSFNLGRSVPPPIRSARRDFGRTLSVARHLLLRLVNRLVNRCTLRLRLQRVLDARALVFSPSLLFPQPAYLDDSPPRVMLRTEPTPSVIAANYAAFGHNHNIVFIFPLGGYACVGDSDDGSIVSAASPPPAAHGYCTQHENYTAAAK
ncbi:hypothetical protein BD309DRAFT_771020 [Dichomitus squalens]|nr:hypothetical protein BD309DRAFT_771020 [Dichomitus squalens]